ncbi:hypothetical protein AB0M39_08705 [Streptomyces sp. NPDC051907]|uniref:hypothetical protein n=1 Tax=Streptomyces sp. NPDC051907 TaxID=3155284 RepID=UPI0034429304
MSSSQQAEAHLCGRLYAVLAALQSLGAPPSKRTLAKEGASARASRNPYEHLHRHLQAMGGYFVDARKRGHGDLATELLRSVPDLLPPGGKELPRTFGHAQVEEFFRGLQSEQAAQRKAHASLA